MSGGTSALKLQDDDVTKFLASSTHIGSTNLDYQMKQYVFKRRPDGVYLIHLKKTWEKLLLAARAIVAIENPADVCAISARPQGQRAILKFSAATGATSIAGRFTPGTFTNQIQAAFREPRLLVVTDPRSDHQPIREASFVNIPVIAFCTTDTPLRYVDIAIPCNNKSVHCIGLVWWMLTREVLRMRGTISRELKWDVMVDLYFYRDPEEAEKEEALLQVERPAVEVADYQVTDKWTTEPTTAVVDVSDWSAEPAAMYVSTAVTDDWSAAPIGEWSETLPEPKTSTAKSSPKPKEDWGGEVLGGATEDWGASEEWGDSGWS